MKILLIRLRLIGDVVFTTPLLGALERTFPESRLTYLVERDAAPVVAGNPHLAQVIVVPRTRVVGAKPSSSSRAPSRSASWSSDNSKSMRDGGYRGGPIVARRSIRSKG